MYYKTEKLIPNVITGYQCLFSNSQQTRYYVPLLNESWTNVCDAGLALIQHCFNVGDGVFQENPLEDGVISHSAGEDEATLGVLSGSSALQSQKAVSPHLWSEQILPFGSDGRAAEHAGFPLPWANPLRVAFGNVT